MRKQLQPNQMESKDRYLHMQNDPNNENVQKNEDSQRESLDEIIRRRCNHYIDVHDALNKSKVKHYENIKDIISNQDARKRVLESLSPLKYQHIEHMYKKN